MIPNYTHIMRIFSFTKTCNIVDVVSLVKIFTNEHLDAYFKLANGGQIDAHMFVNI